MGGNGVEYGYALAVDASASVYVTGRTNSAGWTTGGFDTIYGGSDDAFVVKFGSSGEHLWSSYLGGSGWDEGRGVAVDVAGGVYLTGQTASAGWTSGGFDTSYETGGYYAFVAKLSSSGEHTWSTYLGGGQDEGLGITVDASSYAYLTGQTGAAGWTSGGFGASYGGGQTDAFVCRLSPSGEHLWSTYLGGNYNDEGNGITVDALGGVYAVGRTDGGGWISGGFDTTYSGRGDPFVAKLTSVLDTEPPSPNPSTWATEPYATGDTSIRMVATTASDANGVEYYFEETSGNPGGMDSGWQDSNTYENTGLSPSTTYTYRVKSRDKVTRHHETDYSTSCWATTQADNTPPSPNPSMWLTEPYAASYTSIWMIAAGASDPSSVEYYFREISGNPGGSDSGWQDSRAYVDTGLVPNATYTYQVKTRDKSTNQNETSYSMACSATTEADTMPPNPDPSTWETEPGATGSTSIRMVATVAADSSGVEYYFHETSGNPGATDSGWQDSNAYEDAGLAPGTTYAYEVKTRDKSANHNETPYSAVASAATASPVYRFWKQSDNTHFYTIKESERLKLINDYSNVYTDEGVAYYAYVKDLPPAGTLPVYRFWKASDNTHFYTMNESERQKLLNDYSNVYTPEGVAYYAFLPGQQPTGTLSVYRFWKASDNTHFYTIKESERLKLINLLSYVFTYEKMVWYAYGA